jgi:hypothetical protein
MNGTKDVAAAIDNLRSIRGKRQEAAAQIELLRRLYLEFSAEIQRVDLHDPITGGDLVTVNWTMTDRGASCEH